MKKKFVEVYARAFGVSTKEAKKKYNELDTDVIIAIIEDYDRRRY